MFRKATLISILTLLPIVQAHAICKRKLAIFLSVTTTVSFASYAGAEIYHSEPNSVTLGAQDQSTISNSKGKFSIVFLGDSLLTQFELEDDLTSLWKLRTRQFESPVLDNSQAPESVVSFSELLENWRKTHKPTEIITVTNLARGGAHVQPNDDFLRKHLALVANLNKQIDSVIAMQDRPNLVAIWIGHNDTDWLEKSETVYPLNLELLEVRARVFREMYSHQVGRLLRHLSPDSEVVLFKLLDFRKFYKARVEAEKIYFDSKHSDSPKYPYLEKCYESCKGFLPDLREGLAHSVDRFNVEIDSIVQELSPEFPSLNLRTSEAIYRDMHFVVEDVSRQDAWHFSSKGRTKLAKILFNELLDSIKNKIH
jgi:hypothetical protein